MPDTDTRIRVYRYGLRAPEDPDPVRDQLRLAHRYGNALTEIERRRRDRVAAIHEAHDIVSPVVARVDVAVAEVNGLRDAIAQARKRDRTRSEAKELRAQLKDARAALKSVRAELKAAKAAARADEAVRAALAKTTADAAAEHRAKRAEFVSQGLYWGTYLLVDDGARAAAAKPTPPRFRRFDGTGTLQVQIQKGAFADEIVVEPDEVAAGADRRLRIQHVPDRLGRDRRRFAILWFRIGSDGRAPVWAKFPLIVHRDIPETARIKRASVTLRREGTREIWSCSITVEEPATAKRIGTRAVAIDVGWRAFPESLRVAAWHDSHGRSGDLRIETAIPSGFGKSKSLRSIRDQHRDALYRDLAEMFEALDGGAVPEWLLDMKKHMHRWQSPSRFARLYRVWSTNRFPGDDVPFERLATWWQKERHLHDWEDCQRRKSRNRRADQYGRFAAHIARNYEHVIIEDINLAKLARRAPIEAPAENDVARGNRVDAAPSTLLSALKRACETHGATLYAVPPENTTRTCHACGKLCAWDQAARLRHTCEHCDARWDQDANAARNLLARWRERGGPDSDSRKESRGYKGRWQALKQNRSKTNRQPSEIAFL